MKKPKERKPHPKARKITLTSCWCEDDTYFIDRHLSKCGHGIHKVSCGWFIPKLDDMDKDILHTYFSLNSIELPRKVKKK